MSDILSLTLDKYYNECLHGLQKHLLGIICNKDKKTATMTAFVELTLKNMDYMQGIWRKTVPGKPKKQLLIASQPAQYLLDNPVSISGFSTDLAMSHKQ